MENTIVIPHMGASTEESEDNCAKMAVEQLMEYLENGNIRNSVNFPACDMGVKKTVCRISVLHKNVPNMIGQITGALASGGINISDMTNKSRGDYACTLLDVDAPVTKEVEEKLQTLDGVLKVRIVK